MTTHESASGLVLGKILYAGSVGDITFSGGGLMSFWTRPQARQVSSQISVPSMRFQWLGRVVPPQGQIMESAPKSDPR
jgi:hypothetical protein